MVLPVHECIRPSELAGQVNGRLDSQLLIPINGGAVLRNTAVAWNTMVAAAEAEGVVLRPTSPNDTYRSFEWQDRIFLQRYDHIPRGGGAKWYKGLPWWKKPGVATAAVPGTSNHGWGLAIDVDLDEPGAYSWLLGHAWDYGFSWELQSESWHIRYCLGDHLPVIAALPSPPSQPVPTPQEKYDDMLFYRATDSGNFYAVFYAFHKATGVVRLVKQHITGPDWAWMGEPAHKLIDATQARMDELVDAD